MSEPTIGEEIANKFYDRGDISNLKRSPYFMEIRLTDKRDLAKLIDDRLAEAIERGE